MSNKTLNDIKLIVYDFDGVMTDNKVYVNQNGNEMVMVNRGDGLAVSEIKKVGIEQIIISTEKNSVVKTRSKKDGSAERAVNKQKLNHMYKGAYAFCLKKQICIDTTPIQFEHVSIYKNKMNQELHIAHYIIPTI